MTESTIKVESQLDFFRGFLQAHQIRLNALRAELLTVLGTEISPRVITAGDLDNLATLGAYSRGIAWVQNILERVETGELTEDEAIHEINESVQLYLVRSFDNVVNKTPAQVLLNGAQTQFWQGIAAFLPR